MNTIQNLNLKINIYLKTIIKNIPGSLLPFLITIIFFLIRKNKIKRFSKKFKLKLLDITDFNLDKNKPFFILGTGLSINELSNTEKKYIEDCTSAGINMFVISDLIPTFLTWEDPKKPDLNNLFLKLSNFKKIKYPNQKTHLLLHNGFLDKGYDVNELKIYFNKISLYTTARIILFQQKKLSNLYKYLFNFIILKTMGNGFMYGLHSTVDRLTHFAICAGFKEVVFVGVDLNDPKYFWDAVDLENNYQRDLINLIEKDSKKPHMTERKEGMIPASEIIKIANKYASSQGIKFYTSSKNSKLSSFLPVYEFPFN